MPVINPTGVTAQGNVKLIYVATIADTEEPAMTELSAGTSLDVSCYLFEGGWQPAQEANKVTAPRRLCSRVVYEKFGTTTQSLGDIRYSVSPQAAAASDGKKALEKFVPGATGYLVERLGLDAVTVDFAVGQFVNLYPVVFGPQLITGDTSDEAAEFEVQQPIAQSGPSVQNVALVT